MNDTKENSFYQTLRSDGYCLIKNFFSKDEINDLRSFVQMNRDKDKDVYLLITETQKGKCLLSNKYFDLLKQTLGDKLVYYLDSNLLVDTDKKGIGSFHIDTRNDGEDPGSSDYNVWRVGIYLQDHKNYSGGIKMISSSHKKLLLSSFKKFFDILVGIFKYKKKYSLKSFFPSFKFVNTPSEAGDIIIWNGRTHHAGRFQRLKFFKNLSLHPFIEKLLPKFLFIEEKERLVIFQNWCTEHISAQNYIEYRFSEPKSSNYWKNNKSDFNNFPMDEFTNSSIKVEGMNK